MSYRSRTSKRSQDTVPARLAGAKLIRHAAQLLDEKHAEDISILDVRRLTFLADYFIIVTAGSAPQLGALHEHLVVELKRLGILPSRVDGLNSDSWIVVDYGLFIVHIMLADVRDFYGLDNLWSDAKRIPYPHK